MRARRKLPAIIAGALVLVVAGILLVVVVAALMFLNMGEEPETMAPARGVPGEEPAHPAPVEPTEEGHTPAEAARAPARKGPSPETEAPGATGPGEDAGDEEPTHLLRGRLKTEEPLVKETAELVVTGLGEDVGADFPEVFGLAEVDGSFELDVSSIFAVKARLAELKVNADHPAYLPAQARIPISGTPPPGNGPIIHRVEILLARAAVIFGKVLGPKNAPVKWAEVAVFRMENGEPKGKMQAVGQSREDGTFRLHVRGGGDHVVFAATDGFHPACVHVFLIVGEDNRIPPLILAEGATIEGRVLLSGERGAAKWEVKAYRREYKGPVLWGRNHGAVWLDNRVETFDAGGVTDEEGRFRIEGLTHGRYGVCPADPVDRETDVHMDVYHRESLERVVHAPAVGVNFDIPVVRLLIEVRDAASPLEGIDVTVVRNGEFGLPTDGHGRAELLVAAGHTYEVRVKEKGYEPFEAEVEVPKGVGEFQVAVRLQPIKPKPALIVTVVAVSCEPPRRAGFGFFEPDSEKPFPRITRDAEGEDGKFRVTDLKPGRWRLVVRPGGAWPGGRGFYTQAESIVEILEDGESRVTLETRPAGRLRIAVRGEDGSFLGATCKVLDPTGEPVPVSYIVRKRKSRTESPNFLICGAPNDVVPALPPGPYEIHLSHKGYLDRTVQVVIEAGKTTEVDETLQRE